MTDESIAPETVETESPAETCGAVAYNDPLPCVLAEKHAGRHHDVDGGTWASGRKYGEPERYEITWLSGHIETVLAHQITWPNTSANLLGEQDKPSRIQMMAEIGEAWVLTLSALEDDIRTIRRVTDGERIGGIGS